MGRVGTKQRKVHTFFSDKSYRSKTIFWKVPLKWIKNHVSKMKNNIFYQFFGVFFSTLRSTQTTKVICLIFVFFELALKNWAMNNSWPLLFYSFFKESRIKNYNLKGVFAKNERWYKHTTKNKFFWSLLILLLSFASIIKNCQKRLMLNKVASTLIEKVAIHDLDRKK